MAAATPSWAASAKTTGATSIIRRWAIRPSVDLQGERARELEAEMARDGLLEARSRPSPVLAARCDVERLQADVVAAAPVAGDPAERREANAPPVGRDAHAVDARAAHDGDAPAPLGARPQDGERVVADLEVVGPPTRLEGRVEGVLLGREVHPGEEDVGGGCSG